MTSHIVVLLNGDLSHLISRIALKSHGVVEADAQVAHLLAATAVLPATMAQLQPMVVCAVLSRGIGEYRRVGTDVGWPSRISV